MKVLDNYLNTIPYQNFLISFLNEEKYLSIIDSTFHTKKFIHPIRHRIIDNYNKFIQLNEKRSNIRYICPSGSEVLKGKQMDEVILKKLEKSNFKHFSLGFKGLLEEFSYLCNRICSHYWFNFFINLVIIMNTFYLMLEGNYFDTSFYQTISPLGQFFNIIYILEALIKLIGLRVVGYFKNTQNILDIVIVGICFLELSSPDTYVFDPNSQVNIWNDEKLSFIRFMKVFRLIRTLFYLTKNDKIMNQIFTGLFKMRGKITSFLIMFLIFLFVFTNIAFYYLNHDAFFENYLTSLFNMWHTLTFKNWKNLVYQNSDDSPIVCIFILIWLVIGNFFFLNLLISIIMDSLEELNSSKDQDELKSDNLFKLYEEDFQKCRVNLELKSLFIDDNLKDKDDENEDDRDLEILKDFLNNKNETYRDYFEDNECEYSLYIFSQKNQFRIFLMKLINEKYFTQIITLLIFLSSVRLIVETYFNDNNSINWYFDILDISINICFILELIVKITALGFVMSKGAYLRDHWNKLDFFIVITSVYSFSSFNNSDMVNANQLAVLRVFKILRILRPLRIIAKNSQMKIIITSLLDSINPIISVFILTILIMFIFCIVLTNLTNNLYNTCYQPNFSYAKSGATFWVPVRKFSDYFKSYNITSNDTAQVGNFVSYNITN